MGIMNFLDILSGTRKAGPDEIAGQIVALQDQLAIFRAQKNEAWLNAKKLRQEKMGGAQVSDSAIEKADRDLQGADLDIVSAEESLDALNAKLREAIKEQTEKRLREIAESTKEFRARKDKIHKEIILLAAKISALQKAADGTELSSDGCRVYLDLVEDRRALSAESNKILESMPADHMPSGVERSLNKERNSLEKLNIDEEAERILTEKREAVEV